MKTNFYKIIIAALSIFSPALLDAQNLLEMGATGGPAGNGPGSVSRVVTLYENATTAFTPTITVTYTISNQQYRAGTLEGLPAQSAMNFGATVNGSSNSAMGAQGYYGLMNAVGSPLNSMFSGCNSCGTTGIDVAVNRAVSFLTVPKVL